MRLDCCGSPHPRAPELANLKAQTIKVSARDAEVLGVNPCSTVGDLLAETEVRWSDEDHPEGRPVKLVGLRYTDSGLEPRMERVYPTPWTRCNREEDYRVAWRSSSAASERPLPRTGGGAPDEGE
jgi:hypothetical protein